MVRFGVELPRYPMISHNKYSDDLAILQRDMHQRQMQHQMLQQEKQYNCHRHKQQYQQQRIEQNQQQLPLIPHLDEKIPSLSITNNIVYHYDTNVKKHTHHDTTEFVYRVSNIKDYNILRTTRNHSDEYGNCVYERRDVAQCNDSNDLMTFSSCNLREQYNYSSNSSTCQDLGKCDCSSSCIRSSIEHRSKEDKSLNSSNSTLSSDESGSKKSYCSRCKTKEFSKPTDKSGSAVSVDQKRNCMLPLQKKYTIPIKSERINDQDHRNKQTKNTKSCSDCNCCYLPANCLQLGSLPTFVR